jgi:hypothetical protein
MDTKRVQDDQSATVVKNTVSVVDGTANAQNFSATPTLLLNHKGQKARVASVGKPQDFAAFRSQIKQAIKG